VTTTTRREA